MPSYSGTITSSEGTRTLDVTPNDVITFTPTAATYTVEYPIGTVAIKASTNTASIATNATSTQMRVACASGSVAFANVDNSDNRPLTVDAATATQFAFDAPRSSIDVVNDFAFSQNRVNVIEKALRPPAGAPSIIDLAAQSTLPIRTILVSATGQVITGFSAIVGIQAITIGTGTLTIHDDVNTAGTASNLRFSRADSAMVAGTYYPMVSDDPSAMLMERGAYVTVPTSGVYAIDVIDDRNLANVRAQGLICFPVRVAATALTLNGRTNVVSVKVIAPGSSGNFSIHEASAASDATKLRYPSTAFGSLTADQIIRFGPRGGGASFSQAFVTVPTGGIVLLNTLPR